MLQARFYVESALAALSAVEATGEDVERMLALVARMENCFATKQNDDFIALDAQYHMLIAESSKNMEGHISFLMQLNSESDAELGS